MAFDSRTSSRFSESTPILNRDGKETFGIAKKFKFLDRNNLKEDEIDRIVVDADIAGSAWKLADEVYGDPDLLWVIMQFNHIENALNWPLNGEVIEFPIATVVFSEI